jgi:hypothetical protein
MNVPLMLAGIFVTASVYAVLLHLALKFFGPVVSDRTWLIVSVGCGLVLLWLNPWTSSLFTFEQWVTLGGAFFVGCVPIAARSELSTWYRDKKWGK